jgi:indolepyruvate ferredoxin oxidoreductase, beta subunit
MPTNCDFLLAGVGGQGTLLAADVVAMVGLAQGYDVKKSEVHGMAQRGGSVTSHVRWGAQVRAPLISPGEVDYMLAFERLEGLRYAEWLRPSGTLVENDYCIAPIAVSSGNSRYPTPQQEDETYAGAFARRVVVPAIALAQELGNPRVNNVVLLGALAALLDVPAAVWVEIIAERVPARFVALNRQAFDKGHAFVLAQAG